MFQRILVANRGEIALRIIRTCRELGIETVAVYSEADRGASYLELADEAYCIGGNSSAESYLMINRIISAAEIGNVQAIHPGYGFLSENSNFVRRCEAAGVAFIGPTPEQMLAFGLKHRARELAEQLVWQLPDVILYPTGGGTGLIGMWKAFAELRELGWIGDRLPRMVAVQSSGCAPMVRAFEAGLEHAEPWEDAATVAAGIRVPAAVGDFLILRAVRESGGFAVAVNDESIVEARDRAAADSGFLMCPEGAATLAAYLQEVESGRIRPDESAVLFNCATGLKYPMPPAAERLDCQAPLDIDALRRS